MKYKDLNEIKNYIINSICSTCEGVIKLEDENEKLKAKIKSIRRIHESLKNRQRKGNSVSCYWL